MWITLLNTYINCAPDWTRTSDAQRAGDLQSPGIAAIRPTHKVI